jgi:hypothetical protein
MSRHIRIEFGQEIGKVVFFDVSDTSSIDIIAGSLIDKKFRKRVPLRDDDPPHIQDEEDLL